MKVKSGLKNIVQKEIAEANRKDFFPDTDVDLLAKSNSKIYGYRCLE